MNTQLLEKELIVAAAESAKRQAKGPNGKENQEDNQKDNQEDNQKDNQDRMESEDINVEAIANGQQMEEGTWLEVDLDESNKGKSEESVIRKVREDLALTQDSEDEYLSDASSIILKKREAARKAAFAESEMQKKMQKEKEQSKAIKRPLIEEKGQPRETKRRMEQLRKATEDANNTLERIVITEKIKGKWQSEYDRRKKSRVNLKMKKIGQTAEQPPIMHDPRDPEMRVNLEKRIEVKTKAKPTDESEEMQKLKKQLAEAQRELRENKILIATLQDKVEKQGQLIFRQNNEARRIVRSGKEEKKEMKNMEAQTVQVEQKDAEIQCRSSPEVIDVPPHSIPAGISNNSNCTIHYHVHYHN